MMNKMATLCPMCGEKQVLIWDKGFNCKNKCYEKWSNEKTGMEALY